jgi:hypothetical protein
VLASHDRFGAAGATIGGKLLGGFVCLRRTPWAEFFGVGSDI